MSAVFSWLGGLGEAVAGAFDFLLGLVRDLVYMVQLLGRFISLVPVFFSWLPPQLLAIVGVAVALAVVLKILGR